MDPMIVVNVNEVVGNTEVMYLPRYLFRDEEAVRLAVWCKLGRGNDDYEPVHEFSGESPEGEHAMVFNCPNKDNCLGVLAIAEED